MERQASVSVELTGVREQEGVAVAVGTIIADRPRRRSLRALLRITAPSSDVWRQCAAWDKDGPLEGLEGAPRGRGVPGRSGYLIPSKCTVSANSLSRCEGTCSSPRGAHSIPPDHRGARGARVPRAGNPEVAKLPIKERVGPAEPVPPQSI